MLHFKLTDNMVSFPRARLEPIYITTFLTCHTSLDIGRNLLGEGPAFLCMDWAGQREFTLLTLPTDKSVGGYINLEKLQTNPWSYFSFSSSSSSFFKGISRKLHLTLYYNWFYQFYENMALQR